MDVQEEGRATNAAIRVVMIVDDDSRLLAAYRRAVARTMRVITASNAASARRLACEERPDAAIVDLWLGTESSIELIRELRYQLPSIRIALLTGFGTMIAAGAAIKAGANIVVSKPMKLVELMKCIDGAAELDPGVHPTLEEVKREHAMRELQACGQNVSRAAATLGISRPTLRSLVAGSRTGRNPTRRRGRPK